jgi:hypothetical protein
MILIINKADGGEKYRITSNEKFGYTAGNTFIKVGGNLNNCYYTKDEINSKFTSLNALTFKGGVSKVPGSNDLNLPINEVRIGDVYVVEEAGHYNGLNASIGDLFIAYNDELIEDENGFIAVPSWTYVPSGNEFVYIYNLSVDVNDNSIKLTDNAGSSNNIILADDDVVIATVDGSDGNKINFSHSKTNPGEVKDSNGQTLAAGNSFTTITEVNVNEYGHVIDRK